MRKKSTDRSVMKPMYFILFAVAIFLPISVYAQPPHEPVTMVSPNAAGLGEYGEVPVSLFTGTLDVSIPIYEIKSDNYTLPISLSYRTSGIRPDQHPGWTGFGWTLNAGGAITRIVNDYPDDAYNVRGTDGSHNFDSPGFFFRHDLLDRTDWASSGYLRSVAQSVDGMVYDTAPDEFVFNFPGCSGSFYLNDKGEWIVKSEHKISVKMLGFNSVPIEKNCVQEQFRSFGGFMLIAEDGIKYIFGLEKPSCLHSEENCPIDYSIDIFSQHTGYWFATSWYLSKIILPNNNEIRFRYERVNYICQMYRSTYNRVSIEETGAGFWTSEISCMKNDYPSLRQSYNGKLISPVYLSDISASDSTSVRFSRKRSTNLELSYSPKLFEYGASLFNGSDEFMYYVTNSGQKDIELCISQFNWQKLNAITIQNLNSGSGSFIYQFEYNDNPTERLLLKKITKTFSYEPLLVYTFEYNNSAGLPKYLEEETDHWGFANGIKVSDFGGLAELRRYVEKRQPDPSKMNCGMLNKITYPTGGYSRFEYESHTYGKVVNRNRNSLRIITADSIAGGLRIKKIINSDTGTTSGEYVSKEFFYTSDYIGGGKRSSGILGGGVQYLFEDYSVRSFNAKDTEAKMTIFSMQSILPVCENSCGSHIGYSEVVEKKANGSFVVYKFSNFDSGIFDAPPENVIQKSRTDYEPSSSRKVERGLLTSEEHYTADVQLTYRRKIAYERDMSFGNDFVKAMTASNNLFCENGVYSYDEGAAWKINVYSMREKSTDEYFYEPGEIGYARTVTEWTYNSNKQLSGMDIVRYPAQITDKFKFLYKNDSVVLNLLAESNRQIYFQGNPCASEVHKFRYNRISGTNCHMPESATVSINGVTESRFYSFDAKGRMTAITKDGATTVYVWGYKRKFVVAEIRGVSKSAVEYVLGDLDGFAAKDKPDFTKIAAVRERYPNALVTEWHYNPFLGVISDIAPSGRTVYYEYECGMLSAKKDESGNIIEAYQYNFKVK